jgi:hypothetical protein
MQAGAADALIELHELLAFLETPEERRDGAYIEGEGGDVEEVVEDARDLAVEDAYVLRA